MTHQINRRAMLKGSAIAVASAPAAMAGLTGAAEARVVAGEDGYSYEINRTEAEWRAHLDEDAYAIMRTGMTEDKFSSPLWNEMRAGIYSCKGCDLPIYSSAWKVEVDKGWAFFRHSVPNSLLTDIDWPQDSAMNPEYGRLTAIEVHCRRCGSHLGHIVRVEMQVLHCINGASLNLALRNT